jgi:hypothetical protein
MNVEECIFILLVLVRWHHTNQRHLCLYVGESENRSQMDIKRKTRDIRTWKKHLFLDISCTYPIALPVHRNPQHRSLLTVVSATSQSPFHHLRLRTSLREFLEPVVKSFMPQTLPISLWISFALSPFAHKNVQQNAALRYYTLQTRSPFRLLKPAPEHSHARLLPRLSWSWAVLLPSDTHRKTITSITAVLLLFVTYLPTLPRITTLSNWNCIASSGRIINEEQIRKEIAYSPTAI